MIKRTLKNIGLFLGLLLVSILFFILSIVPQILFAGTKFPWTEEITNAEPGPSILALLLCLSILVITFMRCVKIINKAGRTLEYSEHKVFVAIDRSEKACDTVVYGYNVPIATINAYYSPDGEIVKLVEKQGVAPLLARRQQLTFRAEFLGDAISCIAALMLSLVTAYITGMEIQNISSLSSIIMIVVIAISVASLFLRPVLAEKIRSKYDDDIRRYELQKIDQVLLDYNQKLDLQNINHCGNKERLSEIRKQQKELDMTKSGLKKKKIREKIKMLEVGGEIPHKKTRDARKENATFYEKYRPASWFYILIIVVCAIIRFVPISTGSADLDDVFNDFAVGAAASTWATLLLAELDCNQKNKVLARKKEMVYAEYFTAISDLRFFAAGRCKKFSQEDDQLTFGEWLTKLSDTANYPKDPSPAVTVNRTYFHISHYVKNVKSALITLRQQYCILVESDIVDTDDLRQHITYQINLCDDICDTLELGEYTLPAIKMANEHLVELEAAFRIFFDSSLEERYSRIGKG